MTEQAQRQELHSKIWKIADDVRGAVDGWDFKQYSSKGKRIYVQTSNGWIDHTFSIEQSGSYKIFLEGTTSKSIHITGSITILK